MDTTLNIQEIAAAPHPHPQGVGGEATAESAPAVATIPTLLVFLEDETGFLHWKPDDVKGARWRCSKSPNIEAVCRQAEEVMPERYVIDYVTTKN
jgi:hypothetical protein